MDQPVDPPAAAAAEQPPPPPPPPQQEVYVPEIFSNLPPNPSPNLNHTAPPPSYDEMIETAIRALNEEKGSSRQAIAKYIESSYANLLPSHPALLTHHLKRMKNNGQLVMEKHSYKLPGSFPDPVPVPVQRSRHPDPAPSAAAGGPRRGPGRPPKAKPQAQLFNGPGSETFGTGPEAQSVFVGGHGSGSLPDPHPVFVTGSGSEPESVFVSLGLVDVPTVVGVAKRGRGRPPKTNKGTLNGGSTASGPLSARKVRGRPPRPKSVSAPIVQAGLKRGRGRPPKTGLGSSPKPRGRPKKDAKTAGKPRGRPPKIAGATAGGEVFVPVGGGGGGGGGVLPMKRRGRPPKVGAAKKPKKLTTRPMGRPRKNAATAVEVTTIQQQQLQLQLQLRAYADLKTKLEHVQSRMKLAVSVVKPYLNAEIAVGAVGALQELEELAAMDIAAPLNVQGQGLLPHN